MTVCGRPFLGGAVLARLACDERLRAPDDRAQRQPQLVGQHSLYHLTPAGAVDPAAEPAVGDRRHDWPDAAEPRALLAQRFGQVGVAAQVHGA